MTIETGEEGEGGTCFPEGGNAIEGTRGVIKNLLLIAPTRFG